MRFLITVTLGATMFFSVGVFTATGDDALLTLPPPDQRSAYSELVCSATIVDNQLTGGTMNFGCLTTAENLVRADVDTVFKGKLTTSIIAFDWHSWPVPEDPSTHIDWRHHADDSGVALSKDIEARRRGREHYAS